MTLFNENNSEKATRLSKKPKEKSICWIYLVVSDNIVLPVPVRVIEGTTLYFLSLGSNSCRIDINADNNFHVCHTNNELLSKLT